MPDCLLLLRDWCWAVVRWAIFQSRFARQLPLHKGAIGALVGVRTSVFGILRCAQDDSEFQGELMAAYRDGGLCSVLIF